jgi:hypothetical protein
MVCLAGAFLPVQFLKFHGCRFVRLIHPLCYFLDGIGQDALRDSSLFAIG